MEDATGGWLVDARRLRGFDYRLRVKNLLEEKVRIKTVPPAQEILLLAEDESKSEFFLGWLHTMKKNLTCFHCGVETREALRCIHMIKTDYLLHVKFNTPKAVFAMLHE